MNILYIVTWYTSHYSNTIKEGIFHYEQILELQKTCNVILYYPFDKELKKNFLFSNEKGISVYRRRLRKNKILKLFDRLYDIRNIIKKYNIQIIHAHVAGEAGLTANLTYKIFRIPFLITEHNPIQLSGVENKRIRKRINNVYKNSKRNFCVSPYLKQELSKIFPTIKFETMYNGVISPNIYLTEGNKYYKKGFINCAICAALYDKEIKGFQFLLPALKLINEQGYKVFLHICGGGKYLEYYKNMGKNLNINNSCNFYGQCDKKFIYNLMNEMDFIVSSSLFESAGVSIQEALLLGKPVLVTKSGGTNSLVTNECSIIVEKGSSQALVNGFIEMINKLNNFHSINIKEYAKKTFAIEKITSEYKSVYSSILLNTKD